MSETFIFLLIAAICVLIGAFIGNLFTKLKQKAINSKLEAKIEQQTDQTGQLNEQLERIKQERESIRMEKDSLNLELAKRNSQYENLDAKLREEKLKFEKFEEDFREKFENL